MGNGCQDSVDRQSRQETPPTHNPEGEVTSLFIRNDSLLIYECTWAEKMAQSVKRLECSLEDLSLRPRVRVEKPGMAVYACNPGGREGEMGRCWACLLVSLTEPVSSRTSRDMISKSKAVVSVGRHPTLTHTLMSTKIYTQC